MPTLRRPGALIRSLVILTLFRGMAAADEPPKEARPAVLLPNLGSYHRRISTRSAAAQKFFDQGLRLVYGFNHDEAERSFEEAARLDPKCAICHWGAALCLGPNINLPASAERGTAAVREIQIAVRLSSGATPAEKALIRALASRYTDPAPKDPAEEKKLEGAYAASMRRVAGRFPNDLDVQTLFAESLMDLRPWDLWSGTGEPRPETNEIVSTLERVLAKDPKHPGANHYYVHAIEASSHPEKALPSAQRLEAMMPDAGHLVHMPSHIYIRTGRYEDAAAANRRAIQADERYVAKTGPPAIYQMYIAHNQQFLLAAAMLEGRSAESIQAARDTVAASPVEMLKEMPGFDIVLTCPVLALVRFGRWNEVLAEAAPPSEFPFANAMWHYARGVAFTRLNKPDSAMAEKAELTRLAAVVPADATESLNSARDLLAIASLVLDGRIAAQAGDFRKAVEGLSAAAEAEDKLHYAEPPDWYYPVRHTLGAMLLESNRPEEAERVFREDLKHNPATGWSLAGLSRSLEAQRKPDAARTKALFREAWKNADIQIETSDF